MEKFNTWKKNLLTVTRKDIQIKVNLHMLKNKKNYAEILNDANSLLKFVNVINIIFIL